MLRNAKATAAAEQTETCYKSPQREIIDLVNNKKDYRLACELINKHTFSFNGRQDDSKDADSPESAESRDNIITLSKSENARDQDRDTKFELMEFYGAALTAAWATSDTNTAERIINVILDIFVEKDNEQYISSSEKDDMRTKSMKKKTFDFCFRCITMAMQSMKRTRDVNKAKVLFHKVDKLYDFVKQVQQNNPERENDDDVLPIYREFILDSMRSVSSKNDGKQNKFLLDVLSNLKPQLSSTSAKSSNGRSLQHLINDGEVQFLFEVYAISMRSCNNCRQYSRTMVLQEECKMIISKKAEMVMERKKESELLYSYPISFIECALEASWNLHDFKTGLIYTRILMIRTSKGAGSERLPLTNDAIHWGLNIVAKVRTREAATIAKAIVVRTIKGRRHLNSMHRLLALQACRNDVVTCMQLYELWESRGDTIEPRHYAALIVSASSACDGELALMLHEKLNGRKRNFVTYNAVIQACEKSRMYDKAFEQYDLMKTSGVVPGEGTMSSLLKCCVNNDYYDNFHFLLKQLSEKNDYPIYKEKKKRTYPVEKENIWFHIIKGCLLHSKNMLSDETEENSDDLQYSASITSLCVNRVDLIISLMEPITASVSANEKMPSIETNLRVNDVQSKSDTIDGAYTTKAFDEISILIKLVFEQYPQELTPKLANAAIKIYCQLSSPYSALALFERLQRFNIPLSEKLLTTLYVGLKNNDEYESILRVHKEYGKHRRYLHSNKSAKKLNSEVNFISTNIALLSAVSQKDALSARAILKEIVEFPSRLTFDEATYKHAFHACLMNEDMECARILLTSVKKDEGIVWDQSLYKTCLTVTAMLGDAHEALAILLQVLNTDHYRDLERESIPFVKSMYMLVLRACRNGCHGSIAIEVLNRMKKDGFEVEAGYYAMAISAVGQTGNVKRALQLHEEMLSSGIKPNRYSMNAAISACASIGLWEEAIRLMRQFDLYELEPDAASYASAILACGVGGEWRRAVGLFNFMLTQGIQPDIISYNSTIRACALPEAQINIRGNMRGLQHSDGDAGNRIEGSEVDRKPLAGFVLDKVEPRRDLRVHSINTVVSGNLSENVVAEKEDKCMAIDHIIKRLVLNKSVTIDEHTCTHIIHAYGVLGNLGKALEWFHVKMKELDISRTSLVWTVAIVSCGINDHWENAVKLLFEMHNTPDVDVTRDAIRHSFNACRRCPTDALVEENTFNLLCWCENNGYAHDDFVYRMAIVALRQTKNVNEVKRLLKRVEDRMESNPSLMISSELICVAICVCGDSGQLESAMDILNRYTSAEQNSRSHQECVKVFVYNAALWACERAGDAQKADCLLHEMKERNLVPDIISYTAAIQSCKRDPSSHWNFALQFFNDLREQQRKVLSKHVSEDDTDISCDIPKSLNNMIVEVLWRSERYFDCMDILDECGGEKLSTNCMLSYSDVQESKAKILKINLTDTCASNVACARLLHTLIHVNKSLSENGSASPYSGITGFEIKTGTDYRKRFAKELVKQHLDEERSHGVYCLLKQLRCPLPQLPNDVDKEVTSTTEDHIRSLASLSNVITTENGSEFVEWWGNFDTTRFLGQCF